LVDWRKIPITLIMLPRRGFECNGLISSAEPHRDRRPMSCGVFLRPLMILFVLDKKPLEAFVHLSQLPENRKKLNCD
jgi:hypothetical protein